VPSCSSPDRKQSEDDTLARICGDYVRVHRKRARNELRFYAEAPTDEEAVRRAALAQIEGGKRHPHQYRIPKATLAKSLGHLLTNLPHLRDAGTFDELFDLIAQIIRPIHGIGELAVYDTALRIGARFEQAPDKVYLHAGTRSGARALGIDGRRETVAIDELPAPLRRLTARELEDMLCIYKTRISRVMGSRRAAV